MSELAVSTPDVRATESNGTFMDTEEDFVRVFNGIRTELVSTLFFVLGNHDDAQDAVQEAFLKCWRTRQALTDVKNIRAWIFRVGLNAAKDLQRNAWRRRAKPLGDAPPPEPAGATISASDALENKETLEHLRQALHQRSVTASIVGEPAAELFKSQVQMGLGHVDSDIDFFFLHVVRISCL